jgi:hypothetical protein
MSDQDSPPPFDIVAHHRKRTRQAEARAEALERLNAQLFRLLASILQDWFADTNVDPLEYLQACVNIDQALYPPSWPAGSSEQVASRS